MRTDRADPAARYAAGLGPMEQHAPHDSGGAVRVDHRRHLLAPEFYRDDLGRLMLKLPADASTEAHRKATDKDKERFPEAWARFENGGAAPEYRRPDPTPAGARITAAEFFLDGGTLMFKGPGDGSARIVRKASEKDKEEHPASWAAFDAKPAGGVPFTVDASFGPVDLAPVGVPAKPKRKA